MRRVKRKQKELVSDVIPLTLLMECPFSKLEISEKSCPL